jgi:hypothetical protein
VQREYPEKTADRIAFKAVACKGFLAVGMKYNKAAEYKKELNEIVPVAKESCFSDTLLYPGVKADNQQRTDTSETV